MNTEETGYEDMLCIQQAQDSRIISSRSGELVRNLQVALMVNDFFAERSLDFQKGLYTMKPAFMHTVHMFLPNTQLTAYTKTIQFHSFPNGMLTSITQN